MHPADEEGAASYGDGGEDAEGHVGPIGPPIVLLASRPMSDRSLGRSLG